MRAEGHRREGVPPAGPWALWRQALNALAPADGDPAAAAGELLASLELLEARLYPGTPVFLSLRVRRATAALEKSWESRVAAREAGLVPLLILMARGLPRRPELGALTCRRLVVLAGSARRALVRTPPEHGALRALAWHQIDPGAEAEAEAVAAVQRMVSPEGLAALARSAHRDHRLRFRLFAIASALSLSDTAECSLAARRAVVLGLAAGGGRVPTATRLEGLGLIMLARAGRTPVPSSGSARVRHPFRSGSMRTTVGELFLQSRSADRCSANHG